MKNFFNLLKTDLCRGICSISFLVGAFSTLIIFAFGTIGMIGEGIGAAEVFENSFKYNNISSLLVLASAFACSSVFAVDWQSRFYLPVILRSSKNSYCVSKCISTAIVSGLSLALGAAIFIGFICIKQPFIYISSGNPMEQSNTFYDLLTKGNSVGYFLCYLYVIFMQAAFYGTLGLCASAFFPNKYIAYTAPFVIEFFIQEVTFAFDAPIWLNVPYLSQARVFGVSSPNILLMVTGLFLSLILVSSIVFIKNAKRRLADG